jgi:hypothetical protein
MTIKEPLRHHSRTVTVIPHSGIQFLDFRINSKDARIPRDWGCHDTAKKGVAPEATEFCLARRDEEPLQRETASLPVKYSLGPREVFEMVERRWIPIPLLRRVGQGFFNGPTNWARVCLVPLPAPDPEGNDYHLVLALDTNLMPFVEGRPYLAPSQRDAEAGLVFSLANRLEAVMWYLGEEWLRLWIDEIFREMLEQRRSRRAGRRRLDPISDADVAEELSGTGWAEPLLRYAALLDLLDRTETLPESFRLVDIFSKRGQRYIDCDLILDVGNSRTCGLVVEREGSRADLGRAAKLELRDLSAPLQVYSDPFESRVEFARVSFGKNHLSHRSGRSDAFEWPTLARVGDEAARLAGLRVGNEGNTGMSSPKRYLWSREPTKQPWRLNYHGLGGDNEPFAAQGPFAVLVNDLGEPLHRLADDDPEKLPAMDPRYSRSSLFMFALVEIFLHAIGMVNSPGHRLQQPNSENPRRLDRIIMTIPSALSLAERRILNTRAHDARDLAYRLLRMIGEAELPPVAEGALDDAGLAKLPTAEGGIALPQILFEWDEASATQAVYMYTQIARNFAGHAGAFFDVMRRADNTTPKSLRVATLDIGGGTTDLVVINYHYDGAGANTTIFPEQLFREGFSLAGDDVVLHVIQEHVLGPIEKAAEAAGVPSGSAMIAELFGGNRSGQGVAWEVRRQQFAVQIAQPIAIRMLARYETSEESGDRTAQTFGFAELFAEGKAPSPTIVGWVNEEVARRGGTSFDLAQVKFPVDFEHLERTVRSVLQPMLEVLSEIIWRYRTDVVLVSGRPSRLPAIHECLREALPMYNGRIVPLHHFHVGHWYPFRDFQARIDDPKTTAAVGAMVSVLAEGGIEGFNLRGDRMRHLKSTARYIGKLDGSGRIPAEDTYYADLDLDDESKNLPDSAFDFRGVMALGFRQFPNPWWPATRLYTLDYVTDQERARLNPMTPISVRLARKQRGQDRLSEDLVIEEARTSPESGLKQAKASLALKLQTLRDSEGYWLDTGILKQS